MIPWWATLLINLGLKLGTPWLEKELGPEVLAIMKAVLQKIEESPDKSKAVADMSTHVAAFDPHKDSMGTPPSTKPL